MWLDWICTWWFWSQIQYCKSMCFVIVFKFPMERSMEMKNLYSISVSKSDWTSRPSAKINTICMISHEFSRAVIELMWIASKFENQIILYQKQAKTCGNPFLIYHWNLVLSFSSKQTICCHRCTAKSTFWKGCEAVKKNFSFSRTGGAFFLWRETIKSITHAASNEGVAVNNTKVNYNATTDVFKPNHWKIIRQHWKAPFILCLA